ncbi:MAG: class I SAM-dependent methyltransferase [Alphaproteobacteria bacterium]|jgi:ubiquinone/menaquinone biosynthesis C-methylase UbiE|nr:class I SAM-dependent methyltransferase [Alphaproteobacteria bacterium]
MDKEKIISTYNSIATDYEKAFSEPSLYISDFLKFLSPGDKILDLGCGPGHNSIYLSSLGFEVVGVDLSDKMLELARNKNSKATFIKKDLSNLDFEENSFDHVIAAYSICYLPKDEVLSCLKNLSGIMKTSGIAFIKLQEGASSEITVPEPFDEKLTIDLNVISFDEIKDLLSKSNFSIIKTYLDKKEVDENFSELNELCIIVRNDK